jgi:ribosome-associated protein
VWLHLVRGAKMNEEKNSNNIADLPSLDEIVRSETVFTFSRSSGKGGQNVNKVNTKVTARLNVGKLSLLTDIEKYRLRSVLRTKINQDDEIVIQVQDERSQAANLEIAKERLIKIITKGIATRKKRRPTKPSRTSKEKRLLSKKKTGDKKKTRKLSED